MGLGKKTIDDQNYCGKKVLVRCDFNVPMKDGVITNENRINAGSAHHPEAGQRWRKGHPVQPSGQAQERPRGKVQPGTRCCGSERKAGQDRCVR